MKWLMTIGNILGFASFIPFMRKYIAHAVVLVSGNGVIYYISNEIEQYFLLIDNIDYLFYLLVSKITAHIIISAFSILWAMGLLPIIKSHLLRMMFAILGIGLVYYIAQERGVYLVLTQSSHDLPTLLIAKNGGYALVLIIYVLSYLLPILGKGLKTHTMPTEQTQRKIMATLTHAFSRLKKSKNTEKAEEVENNLESSDTITPEVPPPHPQQDSTTPEAPLLFENVKIVGQEIKQKIGANLDNLSTRLGTFTKKAATAATGASETGWQKAKTQSASLRQRFKRLGKDRE